jgi:hypothetical protein
MDLRLERRLTPRRTTNIAATLVFGGGRIVRHCVVRNISDTGAKIEVASVAGIPDAFDLVVPGHLPQPCRVAWRALREMGLAYRL